MLQRHYSISASDARSALANALISGLISPLNGQSVVPALGAQGVVSAETRRSQWVGRFCSYRLIGISKRPVGVGAGAGAETRAERRAVHA